MAEKTLKKYAMTTFITRKFGSINLM